MAVALSDNSLWILKKRYLEKGETVDDLWNNVSGGNPQYRHLLENLLFMPNSPALFNAGRNNGCTLSACFVFNVSDCMISHEGRIREDSIVRTREKAIAVAKAGGGVGYYGGDIRPRGSLIKTIQRVACGPVAVMRDYHGISALITQGGKRELAQMFVLPEWHTDIEEFIHSKDEDPQSLSSFNISVSWGKEAFDRIEHDRLFSKDPTGSETRETGLFRQQVLSAWKHGCPGVFFPDTVNAKNPNRHLGLMLAPNPCGETPNRTDEPCSLGSLCLWRFVKLKPRQIDWGMLEDCVRIATQFMEDILDRNVFPHPDITRAAHLTRKLGLGVMGWADMLALLGIHYDSHQAVELGRKLMQFINQVALDESIRMAKEKGPYPGFSDKTVGPERRHETNTSIAPTGTIANIVDASWSIEPHLFEEEERTTAEGQKLTRKISVEPYLDGFKPHLAHQIHWKWHIEHQAAFQENTDLGVSKTINMPNKATVEEVAEAYKMMEERRCKGGTIFRDGCRGEQVVRDKRKKKSVYSNGVDILPMARRLLPNERLSVCRKFKIGGVKGYLHVGLYEDGQPGEIFIRISKQGSTVSGMMDAWAMTFSNALQHGTPLKDLVRLHTGHRCEPNGPTEVPEIPLCTSIHDFVVRWMEFKFILGLKEVPKDEVNKLEWVVNVGQVCPDCGNETRYQGGCLLCIRPGCGWSRCG